MNFRPFVGGLLMLLPGGWAGAATDDPGRGDAARVAAEAAAALYADVRTETLPNGLRVYLKPVAGSAVVTTMVAYKVGSADEDLDHTGLAHYLEHLMFKGTERIMPGDIDRLTLRNGGANNANTSEDMTVYHFDFAADRWEQALAVEADRMRNLRIDARHEFEQEKGAVIEELQRDEDEPWDLEHKALGPLLFGKASPYGHPVIGEREHVKGATAKVIKGFYDRWYYPNNAVLVVCGGFDPDRALAKIRELFGPISQGDLPPRRNPAGVSRDAPARSEFPSKFEVPRMVMGFNTVRKGDPADYAFDVIQTVLSGGKTGRLYRKLVEGEEIASAVETSNNAGRYPGWFGVQVEVLQGKDWRRTEELVVTELKRLADEPVGESELKRAKQQILSAAVFGRESVHSLADSIARGVTTNDLDYLKGYLPRVAAVSAKDVQDVARRYLDPDRRAVVWSVPRKEGAGGGKAGGKPDRERRRNSPDTPGTAFAPLRDARRVVLDNGLTLLLLENHRLPVVVAQAYVRDVRLHERDDQAGVATLTGRLLDEGTPAHTGPQIAELIENVGGELSFSPSGGGVKVLAPDRHLGLGLLLECLSRANFPPDSFARERQRLLSQIEDAEQQPETKARIAFQELVYGKHPFGRPAHGRREAVAALTPGDCAAFHRAVFVPNNTLLAVVGDFDAGQVIDDVKQMTAGWKKGALRPARPPEVEKPARFVEKIVTMPGAVQLQFYMGHPGIRRDSPDFYKLLVMDYVLGTGPGFTDRLSARARDREGLAYTVSANITSSAAEEPGAFTCYIGTAPANLARVKSLFLEELNRIRNEPPTPQEVEDAKQYLLGNLPFQFTTNAQVAGQLLVVERFGLGFDYFAEYRKQVAAVAPADVQAVARKYLDPARMVLVAVGPVDAQGKSITPLPPPRPKTEDRIEESAQ
jgi:zinc protease